MLHIRHAQAKDIQSITDIYNEAICSSVATFDIRPKLLSEQTAWFNEHGPNNPILVAEKKNIVAGWAALSKWSNRCAYKDTAEISVYIKKQYQGKNIGKHLLQDILWEGEKVGLHTIIALITEGNKKSVLLHESFGFLPIGVIKEAGYKFGRYLDVYIMQKIYASSSSKD
jgi:phosphinothricin acetyltransferase